MRDVTPIRILLCHESHLRHQADVRHPSPHHQQIHRPRWRMTGFVAVTMALTIMLMACGAKTSSAASNSTAQLAPPQSETGNQEPETRDIIPETRNPEPGTPIPPPLVQTGLDILAAEGAERLAGKRVGVMALPTSLTSDGRPILDVLLANETIIIAALYAIHPDSFGVAHDLATDTFEPRSGAPLYTLSARRRRPTAEMLRGLDVVVIDVPDSGVRFNPSLSRVTAMLQECARRNVPVMVLDRPNPLGGLISDGPYPAPALLQHEWAPYPMPLTHGLTLGEMARVLEGYFGLGGPLDVVACTGWKRYWTYEQTELPWRAPAPELATPESNLLFAGLALAEPANVSVGLGTDRAFRVIGAPYMNAAVVLAEFERRPVPGVAVEAAEFTPAASGAAGGILALPAVPRAGGAPWAFAGEPCRGVAFRVTDRDQFQPVKFGIQTLHILHKLYPDQLQAQRAALSLGRADVMQMITIGQSLENIFASWNADRLDFNRVRIDYLLY